MSRQNRGSTEVLRIREEGGAALRDAGGSPRCSTFRDVSDTFDSEQVIHEVAGALQKKFPDRDPAEVERVVRAQVDDLKDRPVQDYVSVLAKRAAKKQLDAS